MSYFIDAPVPVVIVPIEQPPERYELDGIFQNKAWYYQRVDVMIRNTWVTELPLPIGAKVGVRTPRAYSTVDAFNNVVELLNEGEVQTWLTVSSVAVKQVKDLTAEEMPILLEMVKSGVEFTNEQHPYLSEIWVEVAGLKEVL